MLLGKGGKAGDELARRLAAGEAVSAPHLLDVEVAQVIRRYALKGELSPAFAQMLVDDLTQLPITRYPHLGLVNRALEMLSNVTVYDGTYLALAEALDCPLLTGDQALMGIPGCTAEVHVLSTGQS